MTKLEWDKVGERFYETGVDRGVLYFPDIQGEYNDGVAWNGLTSVEEDFGDDETESSYFDGVKYIEYYPNGDFSAQLSAFTYPDEFLEFEGVKALGDGLYVDDQRSKVFGLSYRTLAGNDLDNLEHGYKIHLLYNMTAVPDSIDYQNGSNLSEPVNFSWEITSIPEKASPYRPTSHVILDSRYLNADLLEALEYILYGRDRFDDILDGEIPESSGPEIVDGGIPSLSGPDIIDGNENNSHIDIRPTLPSLDELITFILFWDPRIINSESSTGLASLTPGRGDLTPGKIIGLYYNLPETRLVESEVYGLYRLSWETM